MSSRSFFGFRSARGASLGGNEDQSHSDGYNSGEILAGDSEAEVYSSAESCEFESSGGDGESSDDQSSTEPEMDCFHKSKKRRSSTRDSEMMITPSRSERRVLVPSSDPTHKRASKKGKQRHRSLSTAPRSSSSVKRQLTQPNNVAEVLSEITNTLTKVVRRLDAQEKVLEQIRVSASSSSSSSEQKTKVPLIVRSEVRRMYKALCDEDLEFPGFNTDRGVTFKDPDNTKVVDKLVKEVQGANPEFQSGLIRAAAYTYYRSVVQEESLKRRGKLAGRNKTRRRRERQTRKLKDRISTLKKSSMSDKDRGKWMSVLVPEFMSSEDSDSEQPDRIIKHPLTWRSSKVDDFFKNLDRMIENGRSGQSKRQTMERSLSGACSERPAPMARKYPSWTIIQEK